MGVLPTARQDLLGFFLRSARRYGEIVSMRFGVRRVYLLSHPDHIKHVLQDNHRAYGKGPPAGRVRVLFGDSLTTVDGDRWWRQRRLIGSAFQPRRLMSVVAVVTQATAELLDRWRRIAERHDAIDLLSEMKDVARTMVFRVLFGDVGATEARAIGQALDFALERVHRRLWSPLGGLDIVGPGRRRFQDALRSVDVFVAQMVERARREACPCGTLLATLRDVHDAESGEPMSDVELREELKALLVAGYTTTASALAWVWCVLAGDVGVRQRLQQELRTVLEGRVPQTEDLPALRYTRMLIEEVLRLYPPTWVTARMPLRDDEIGGYRISPGAIVLLSPFVTHRHPEFWEDPDRFDPERFAPERSAGRHRFAYFPFGGGPRSCIGSGLAFVEMQLVVAMVAQRYQLLLTPGCRVDVDPGLTLRPRPVVSMTLTPNT